jgi:hypothetical protein
LKVKVVKQSAEIVAAEIRGYIENLQEIEQLSLEAVTRGLVL